MVVKASLIYETMQADPSLNRNSGKGEFTSKKERSKKDKYSGKQASSPEDHPAKRKRDDKGPKKSTPSREKRWANPKEALAGVDQADIDKHKKDKADCCRCGRSSHKTLECFASKSASGKDLPAAPEKISGIKRKGSKKTETKDSDDDKEEAPPPAKKAKVAALLNAETASSFPRFVELSDTDESPSDF